MGNFFSNVWHTFFFDPVYNTLVFFIDVIPGGDLGFAIIATVLVVKTILLPLSIKAAKTQRVMREIEPALKEIREKHKDNREDQARAMMDIYKNAGLNPFAAIFLLFIQIPIIIALYFSVSTGGGVALPEINTELLYSFIPPAPDGVSMQFLGYFDMAGKSLILAFLAGLSQFFQIRLAMPPMPPKEPEAEPNFKDDMMRNLQLQMRYVMPIVIFFVSYTISASIALYFLISNLTMILQEVYVKKHRQPLQK
jgi:YidC/Oxa1 family membrane protein insertase